MDYVFLWGLVALVCGAFMLVYGSQLFRFVLAFAGFYIGFTLGMMLPMPSQALQMLVALVVGGVGAALLYMLVNLTLYLAGGLLGLVLGFVLASIFNLSGDWFGSVIGLAGAVVGAIFGRSLGDWAMILASAAAGAYATVVGLNLLFNGQAIEGGLMPTSLVALTVFAVFMVVSVLAQMQIRDLRRRLRGTSSALR